MYSHIKWLTSLLLAAAMVLSITGTAAVGEAEGVPPSDNPVAEALGVPTYQDAYDAMISRKTAYPEGMTWTNFTPYGRDGAESAYWFKGGKVQGASGGVGCAAFVFLLSDAAFGDLPARTLPSGGFTFEDVNVGDILRVDNNSHFVIVLQKSTSGVIIAEANYNKSVHWGRALSEAEVMHASFLVTRYPVGYLDPSAGDADEVDQSGTENGLAWELTKGGMLTITGTGAIPDYTLDSRPAWEEYSGKISAVTIGSGITGIGDYAFYGSGALSVSIPDTVTNIGDSAFRESGLVAVTIPGSVQSIGDDAFRTCTNMTSVSATNGLKTIGERAFRGCTSIGYMDFPSSITSLGAGAFMDCSNMIQVRFAPGTGNVTIGDDLFRNCQRLLSVFLPEKADRISNGMFASCKLLYELYIPSNVSSIMVIETGAVSGPFMSSGLQVIHYQGSESDWTSKNGNVALNNSGKGNVTVHYNVPFNNPFAADPDDPGDLVGDPDTPPVTPDKPEHQHVWSTGDAWETNETHHWRTCSAANCPITDNSQKEGYGAHSYGGWVTDTAATASQSGSRHRDCALCGYRQTGTIPATGGSSSGSGSSSSSSSGTSSVQKPGGSATTTVTDAQTGTKTETTKHPDGSTVVTMTQKDGTVTTTATNASGQTEIEVRLSNQAIQSAGLSGRPVSLPVGALRAARNAADAQGITVRFQGSGPVLAAIPVDSPTTGTVAVVVNADGTTSVLKTSVPVENGIAAPLTNGVTVKLVDNSKHFSDVPAGAWMEDAIAFVSARELFAGTTETTFAPEMPMTRAMLMTVLARFDGADITGGAAWYTKGVEWAVARGVSDGSNPDGNITREQLVMMLWRYRGSPAAGESLSSYTDAAQISGYAQEAMRWAVESGLISGVGDGRLSPQGLASRAQVAQILKNFILNAAFDPA